MKNYMIILFLFVLYHANGQIVTFSKIGVCVSTGIEVMDDVYYGIHRTSGSSICIGKFDTLGNVISSQSYSTLQPWFFYSPKLVSSVDGHLAIVMTRNNTLGLRGILVDFDTSGSIISETILTIPNVGIDSIAPYDLAATKDSGYIVVSSVSYLGYPKIGVIKMDKNKNNQWEVLLDVNNGVYMAPIPDVLPEDDGGYLVSYQFDDCDFNHYCPNVKCILVKLDSVGNTIWTWTSDPNIRLKGGNDMTKTKDGGWVIASAALTESISSGGVSPEGQCGYVFKIDSVQNFLWGKRLEGVSYSWYDKAARIIELEDSSLISFGTVTDSFSSGYLHYKGYVFKFSADGDSIWSRQYSHLQSGASFEMHDAEKLPDGGFLISGNSYPGVGWLLKLDEHGCLVPGCHLPLGVLPAGALENFRLCLYPNPTTDYLNVFYQSEKLGKELTFSVIDMQGKVLQNYTTMDESDKTYIVPVYELVTGIYVLEVRRDGKLVKSEKFVKN